MTAPLWAGARRALPVVLGYLPVGFAFGVLAVRNGMPPWMAVLMSLIVYAGSAQLIAAGLIGAGVPALSIIATTFVVNLRHMLMSTALAPWLSRESRGKLILFGFELTDETFALYSRLQAQPPAMPELLACNAVAQAGWVAGTVIGAFFSGLLGDTSPFGLDFTLAAMFIALLVPQCGDRPHLLAGILAALLSVALTLLGANRWAVVIATVLTAGLAGWLVGRRTQAAREQSL